MQTPIRYIQSAFVVLSLLIGVFPCGPAYVSPVFTIRNGPEDPYLDFAAGRLGIVRPEFHRSVLYAAYRWINGSGLDAEEQKAVIEVWNADYKNRDFGDNDVSEAVKAWVKKREEVLSKEEQVPEIYVERNYGGYDFFPNCTKNAFETATETLSARIASHGSESRDVRNWLEGQDAVFTNCSSGKQMPAALSPGASQWLQKDRAYQIAAAEFYSLDYVGARKRFSEIASDTDSPWQETADYLVARTLIRQASLTKDKKRSAELYSEAEHHLARFASVSGKFTDSADRLLGLVKYRLRPDERLRELAHVLSLPGGGPGFRQNMIDYTWLLDKFERAALEEEEARKQAERPPANTSNQATNVIISPTDGTALANKINAAANAANTAANSYSVTQTAKTNESDLEIALFNDDYSQSWRFFVPLNATDDEAIAEAERQVGSPLTDEMKKRVQDARQNAYASRFNADRNREYEGGYHGSEELSLSLLPEVLRSDDLTEWLFTYQIGDNEAYLYSLSRFKATTSDLWLMTALSKAKTSSAELDRLLAAAGEIGRSSPAYVTVAFHAARLNIDRGRPAEARKIIDEAIARSADLPISTVNEFMKLRFRLAETLNDFLRYALRRPFAFDYGGSVGTIDQFIEEQKGWFNPEYHKEGKEAYDLDVEKQFASQRLWQDRLMFDVETINLINLYFPGTVLAAVESSDALPDYLRERFAVAVWTRAALLGDFALANRMAPRLIQHHPDLAEDVRAVMTAAGSAAKRNAFIYLLVRNPKMTPFVEDGLGKTDNEADVWDTNDWWCEPYDEYYDENIGDMVKRSSFAAPKFLTSAQLAAAASEGAKLKSIGDAPKYMAERVLEWARRSPSDPRVPESLFRMYKANGWSKWGCGGDPEIQQTLSALLMRRYPASPWTQRLIREEDEN